MIFLYLTSDDVFFLPLSFAQVNKDKNVDECFLSLKELSHLEFFGIFISHGFNDFAKLSLYKCNELLYLDESFRFVSKQINPCKMTKIINNG